MENEESTVSPIIFHFQFSIIHFYRYARYIPPGTFTIIPRSSSIVK